MPEEPEALDFADLMRDLGHGATNKQATKLIREAINACEATGGKAKITLTLSVSADKDNGLAEIAATAKATLPQGKLLSGTFHTKNDSLYVENPRQAKLPLKSMPPTPIRTIKPEEPS